MPCFRHRVRATVAAAAVATLIVATPPIGVVSAEDNAPPAVTRRDETQQVIPGLAALQSLYWRCLDSPHPPPNCL